MVVVLGERLPLLLGMLALIFGCVGCCRRIAVAGGVGASLVYLLNFLQLTCSLCFITVDQSCGDGENLGSMLGAGGIPPSAAMTSKSVQYYQAPLLLFQLYPIYRLMSHA
jgi:hypothetical protein